MGLTDEEVGRLTLADMEAIATRLEAAVRTIREAQAMLGGAALEPQAATHAPKTVSERWPTNPMLTPAEQAQRNKLLRQIRGEDMPPDIRAAMEDSQ